MNGWMMLWSIVLGAGVIGFVGLLTVVGGGAIRELRQMLDDLREDTRESAEHPETLDEVIS